jgi:hypothetical protein
MMKTKPSLLKSVAIIYIFMCIILFFKDILAEDPDFRIPAKTEISEIFTECR